MVTEGEYVASGTDVIVIQVEGQRILVKKKPRNSQGGSSMELLVLFFSSVTHSLRSNRSVFLYSGRFVDFSPSLGSTSGYCWVGRNETKESAAQSDCASVD